MKDPDGSGEILSAGLVFRAKLLTVAARLVTDTNNFSDITMDYSHSPSLEAASRPGDVDQVWDDYVHWEGAVNLPSNVYRFDLFRQIMFVMIKLGGPHVELLADIYLKVKTHIEFWKTPHTTTDKCMDKVGKWPLYTMITRCHSR